MKIDYRVIPHKDHRYPTVGDYWETDDRAVHFRVSDMGNELYETLVFIHEMVEYCLCKLTDIDLDAVDTFDNAYEQAREDGAIKAPCGCPMLDEPGDDPHAPYHRPHMIATSIERLLAWWCRVDWDKYNATVGGLE